MHMMAFRKCSTQNDMLFSQIYSFSDHSPSLNHCYCKRKKEKSILQNVCFMIFLWAWLLILYLLIFIFFTLVRTLNMSSLLLTNLWGHSTILLTIGKMLCRRSLKLICLVKLKLCTCLIVTPHFLPIPIPGNYYSALCSYEFDYFILFYFEAGCHFVS